ncbi:MULTISPECIES: pseudaminic acid biosynthesis-associated methylase [unclassified Nostoc]|uniref:pseudaminic acid biosynthesis-associated methylase n=1 Tax=unclassified Nostoc TaxID=2593658 RepID=UPI0013D6C889|nr:MULTISPECIES: pseudaminic acid biosynthesis-associated methylase [unclassified Nostoc]MBE8998092.1 methyltransferase domain-containing protein [Nostoc sp. LEGE 12447]NEU80794.1 methyltransferase domain-containing protein [Nostoc sp. UIC 10630]
MRYKTEQELFWEGEFGTEYTARNQILPEQRQAFFAQVLQKTYGVQTICELGANQGHNLQAIANLSRNFQLTGVELNETAIAELGRIPGVQARQGSIQEFETDKQFDLVFTCGVLIHINPDELPLVYQKIYDISCRYILINEYYSTLPVEINYRGNTGKLFKRDFASEIMEYHRNKLLVLDYGFLWKKMNLYWDDTNWFLMEKVL